MMGLSLQVGADSPVVGLNPSKRPDSAPTITEMDRNSTWYSLALTGISRPYPSSLSFLDDQGNWYTPFIRPGMVGRYDIRGWHEPAETENDTP